MNTLQRMTLIFFLVLGMSSGYSSGANAAEGLGSTVKEIFVKGSIDDNKLFLVLGFGKASEIAKKSIKTAIGLEDLKHTGIDLAGDVSDNTRILWNKDEEGKHDDDLFEHAGEAADFALENLPNIAKAPYKSIKKIPGAFEVSMSHAREAYWEGENRIASTMKYAGHAIWASTKAGYYLVIEAPAVAIGHIALSTLAVPGAVAWDVTKFAFSMTIDLGVTAIKLGYHAVRAIYQGAKALFTTGYSLASTTVAITATTAAAGVIAIFNGINWIITRPAYLFNPARISITTELDMADLSKLAQVLKDMAGSPEMVELGINTGYTKSKIDDYKASITFYNNNQGRNNKAAKVSLSVKSKKVKIKAFIYLKQTNRLYKKLKDREISKRAFRKELRNTLAEALAKAVVEAKK